MIEDAKRRLEAGGIDMPFPHRIVHVVAPGAPGAPSGAKGQTSPKPPPDPA